LIGQTVSDELKNGFHESSLQIRHIARKSDVQEPKLIATYSALSAAYAAPGWLPAVRFIPTERVSGGQPATVIREIRFSTHRTLFGR